MKKNAKRLIATLVLVVALIATVSITAFAVSYNVTLSGTYTEVVGSGQCSNRYVTITCYNTNSLQHQDVKMLDSSGNTLWEEYGAIDYSDTRTFWCGSNVYSIEVRIGGKNIIGDWMPKIGSCNVSW